MKPIFVSIFSSLIFSSSVLHAQYTCNDRTQLKQMLAQLDIQCGAGFALCKSYGHKGGSVELAISACVKAGTFYSTCSRDVTCEGAILCDAYGSKGSTAELAIAACMKNGTFESTCTSEVSCK